MEIFCPIFHLGCLSASLTVTSFKSFIVFPLNGPPDAVNNIFLISLFLYPLKLWNIALCSESTGNIFTLFSFALFITSSPATTNVSLFAKAISFFASIAAIVGFNPIIPTTEVTTVSISSKLAILINPSIPSKTCILGYLSLQNPLIILAESLSIIATYFGLNSIIISLILLTDELALTPIRLIFSLEFLITSRV